MVNLNTNFKTKILVSFEFCKVSTFHSHFQLKSKQKGQTSYTFQEIDSKISKQLSKNKNRPIIVSFDRFHYQSFAIQAMPSLPSS